MKIFTDNILFAEQYFPESKFELPLGLNGQQKLLAKDLLPDNIFYAEHYEHKLIDEVYITPYSKYSQYDLLTALSEQNTLRCNIVCIAGAGSNFHGYKDRKWAALAGNLHVSIYLSPETPIENFNTGFTIITALSIIDALDTIPALKGKAGIKWVNDIMIGKSKISGVLARTRLQGMSVTDVIVGAGLNIAQKPDLSGDVFVKQATSIKNETGKDYSEKLLFDPFLEAFVENCRLLLTGKYNILLEKYRNRSCLIGEKVKLLEDKEEPRLIAEGTVTGIGNDLELYIDGIPQNHGRVLWM